jgi:Peptidase C1-like family
VLAFRFNQRCEIHGGTEAQCGRLPTLSGSVAVFLRVKNSWVLIPPPQSYLFFWDKLEKSNYYLELSIELAAEPLDSRIVSHLAQECGISDGGQYDMVRLSPSLSPLPLFTSIDLL